MHLLITTDDFIELEKFSYFAFAMSRSYKFRNKSGLYFVSFSTVNWIDVFTRQKYFDVLCNSLNYCRIEKGMEVYAYCFMPSHLHLIFRAIDENPSDLLRDFKRHTSKKLVESIKNNPQESRKEWLLRTFKEAGEKKTNISNYQFWQHHNNPIELWSLKVIKQKIDYIHNNPVKTGFVTNPEDWKYSSARNFMDDNTVLEIDSADFIS